MENRKSYWEEVEIQFEDGSQPITITVDAPTARRLRAQDIDLINEIRKNHSQLDLDNISKDDQEATCSNDQQVTYPTNSISQRKDNMTSTESKNNMWSNAEIISLITNVGLKTKEFEDPKRKKIEVWAEISSEMQNEGFKKEPYSCEKKWSNLKIRYRTIKDNNKKTGNSRSTWLYYDMIDDILGDSPSTDPVATISSNPSTAKQSSSKGEGERKESTSRKRKVSQPEWVDNVIKIIKQSEENRREDFKSFKEEFMKCQHERNDILREILRQNNNQ